MPRPSSRLMKIGYVGAGLLAGAVLATTITAQAASPTSTPTTTGSTSTTTIDPHPGDNGADGVPESQEVSQRWTWGSPGPVRDGDRGGHQQRHH